MPELERVRALLDIGRVEQAKERLAGFLAEEPGDAEALCLLAYCHREEEAWEASLSAAEAAIAADPASEYAQRLRAMALLPLGRVAEAEAAAREAVRIEPEIWAGHVVLGMALYAAPGLRRHRAGRAAFARAKELAPDEGEIHRLQGNLHHSLGAKRRARREYLAALRLNPDDAGALRGLSALALAAGRTREAVRHAWSAGGLDPSAALVEYVDQALIGTLGQVIAVSYVAMIVLLFGVFPLAWALAAVIVAAIGLRLWMFRRGLPKGAVALARQRLRRDPRVVARVIFLGISLLVALGIGVGGALAGPDRMPAIQMIVLIVTIVALGLAAVVVDRRAAREPSPTVVETELSLPEENEARGRLLLFRLYRAALLPALVMWTLAIEKEPNWDLRAGLGTGILVVHGLWCWSISWRLRRAAAKPAGTRAARRLAARLRRWRRVPEIATRGFGFGWFVLVVFLLGAAYLPNGAPLDPHLAAFAFVTIAYGIVALLVMSIIATVRWLRQLSGYSGA